MAVIYDNLKFILLNLRELLRCGNLYLKPLVFFLLVGSESEEIMSVVIQATEKVRMKALKHVIKNIGPIEINIWEPAEEGAANDEHCYDRFSLGTSLSRSTLTDLGNPQVYSDGDTADTLSDALFAEEMRAQTPSLQRYEQNCSRDLPI